MIRTLALTVPILLAGCATREAPAALPYTFEARLPYGEVRVLPTLALHDDLALNLESWVGAGVSWSREGIRRERTAELGRVPTAVGLAFPGAVNGQLGSTWNGRFAVGRFPAGGRERITHALRTRGWEVDGLLSEVARGVGGDAALFTWVSALEGTPLTAEELPGEVVETAGGPVMVDLFEEPYRVRATVGMALVTGDGEVVLRYADDFESVLSSSRDAHRVARDLARGLAAEVGKVWPVDPYLAVGEEEARLASW